MTGVAVQNMATGGRTAIRCGAHVLKIAVYERRLAVQLRARVLVYGLPADAALRDLGMHVIARVERAFDCNLLMVAAHHLILCQVSEPDCVGLLLATIGLMSCLPPVVGVSTLHEIYTFEDEVCNTNEIILLSHALCALLYQHLKSPVGVSSRQTTQGRQGRPVFTH